MAFKILLLIALFLSLSVAAEWEITTFYSDSACTQQTLQTGSVVNASAPCFPQSCIGAGDQYISSNCVETSGLPTLPPTSYGSVSFNQNSCSNDSAAFFVASTLKVCFPTANNTTSLMYNCDSSNVYILTYKSSDCSGTPVTTEIAIGCMTLDFENAAMQTFCDTA